MLDTNSLAESIERLDLDRMNGRAVEVFAVLRQMGNKVLDDEKALRFCVRTESNAMMHNPRNVACTVNELLKDPASRLQTMDSRFLKS